MTFADKYLLEESWSGKILIMEIYHLGQKSTFRKNWTMGDTAEYFKVSPALVSENLKIATYAHQYPEVLQLQSREAALRNVNAYTLASKRLANNPLLD